MSEPTDHCGWHIQRNDHLFDDTLTIVRAERDGTTLYFRAADYDDLDDQAFEALADARAKTIQEPRP